MNNQESPEFKSFDSAIQPKLNQIDTRISLASEKELLKIYNHNIQKKKQLQQVINKLQPKVTKKKLAAELEHDSRVTAIQIYVGSDDNEDFDDIDFDFKSIQTDYTTKKGNLDDIKKNKYAPLQTAFIRKIWEKELSSNKDIIAQINKKFTIKAYFPMTNLNKFGVLISSSPKNFIIKFISVGIPQKMMESVEINHQIEKVYSKDMRIIVVTGQQAKLYDIQAKQYILKTHQHESNIVYAGFYSGDTESILTVTSSGIARLFDIKNRTFYWMCMTDTSAQKFLIRQDKLYYSVKNELLSINIKTKEMVSIHKYAQPIQQINERYLRSGKLLYSWNSTEYQTKNGLDHIKLTPKSSYSGGHISPQYVIVNDKKINLEAQKPQFIGVFKIKNYEGGIVGEKNVAIFGDIYGKTLEIDLDGISA